jgi:hypothetical protein
MCAAVSQSCHCVFFNIETQKVLEIPIGIKFKSFAVKTALDYRARVLLNDVDLCTNASFPPAEVIFSS